MAQGLQIFDANGVTVLDSATRTVKIVAKIDYEVSNLVFYNDLFASQTPFAIIQPPPKYNSALVVFEGSKCTVTNEYTPPSVATIYIGVM